MCSLNNLTTLKIMATFVDITTWIPVDEAKAKIAEQIGRAHV